MVHAVRSDPSTKDSSWVKARQSLGNHSDVNELLLVSEDGDVLEGSSSSFFAVVRLPSGELAVQTTMEHVLVGTVQKVVVHICRQIGVPVILTAPKRNEMHEWQEAFIASTSRWVLPIGTIYDHTIEHHLPRFELGMQLAQLVQQHAVEYSESLYEN